MIANVAISLFVGFALVATRMAAFVAVSPFPGPTAPSMVRIGLALLLALAASPFVTPVSTTSIGPELALAAFGEASCGATIGFVFRVGLSAADVLGSTLAQAMGLTFASSYDPTAATNADPLTRITTMTSLLVSFSTGAHRLVIGAVLASYRALPSGGILSVHDAGPEALRWAVRSLECGLGLALPAMTVAVVVQLSLGLVARAAPSLQVFSVGFSITLGSVLAVFVFGLGDTLNGLAVHLFDVPHVLERCFGAGS